MMSTATIRAQVLLLALLASTSCRGDPESRDHSPRQEPFAIAFPETGRVRLTTPPDNPIGDVSAVTSWRGHIVIVDELQSDAKVFNDSGRFVRSLGGPGHGPGEFRQPFAAAAVAGGRLAVLDRHGRLTLFDSTGALSATYDLPIGVPGTMKAGPDSATLLVAAKLARDPSNLSTLSPFGVHQFSLEGTHLTSFRRNPAPISPNETSFNGTVLARAGTVVVVGQYSRNQLDAHDLTSGREWQLLAGASRYSAPDWKESERHRTLQEGADFWRRSTWLTGLVPVGCSHVVARFTSQATGERLHLVLAHEPPRR